MGTFHLSYPHYNAIFKTRGDKIWQDKQEKKVLLECIM